MWRLKFSAYVLVMTAFVLVTNGCSPKPDVWKHAKPGQKKVLVSFAPLYCFAHAVAGDDAYVLSLLTTQGPHDYEGTPTDLFKINEADLYIYNGLTLDDVFTDKMLRNHKNRNLVSMAVGDVLNKMDKEIKDDKKKFLLKGDEIEHMHADGKMHKHGSQDPHIWLGPRQAKAITKIIAAKLGAIDPANAAKYEKRAGEFAKKLDDLQAYGDAAFKDKKSKNFISMHESLGYFGKEFLELEKVDSIQVSPGIDPDAKKIADLITLCKEKNIRVIAKEPQYSGKVPELIRDSLKRHGIELTIVEIDPLETAQATNNGNPDPEFYLKKMRENIDTLAKALP